MRLLLVSPIPPPVGGIATWSVSFLNYFSKNQKGWFIFHQNTAIKYRNITNNHFIVRLYGGIRDTISILNEFKKNLKEIHPDIVHLTSSGSYALIKDLLLVIRANKKKIPLIIHFRFGRIPMLAKSKNWEWLLLKLLLKRCKRSIVIDQKSFAVLRQLGFENIDYIPNPISSELEEIAELNHTIPTENNIGKVVFIGHAIPSKGIFELVKASNSINEVKNLIIIGPFENHIKEDLMALIEKKENKNWLFFTGNLDRKEVFNHLRSASLMALPSYTEGFPNVVLEAMAFGCPIVATDVGAIPDMIDVESHNPCGICISPKNVSELRNAITTLLNNPVQAKIMGENGRSKVLKHYTFSGISKQYEMTWNKALNKS